MENNQNDQPELKPQITPQDVPPIGKIQQRANLGIIPTGYRDSMTYYELVAWLCKYVEDTVIPALNNNANGLGELQTLFQELVKLYNQLKDYVNNYFDTLDLQDEVNNKIDELEQSGLLYKMIGKNKVNKLAPEWISKQYLYTITYDASNYTKPFLAVSKDGFNWEKVYELPEDAFVDTSLSAGNKVYDISSAVIGEYFYMIYDYIDSTYNDYENLNQNIFLGGNRVGVSRTKDFLNWESWNLEIDLAFKQTWAPEFFIDDNKYYITIALGNGTDTVQIGTKQEYFKTTYLLECDPQYQNILNYTKNFTGTFLNIDPFLYKEGNSYYLLLKNEESKWLELYQSTDILNFQNKIATLAYYNKDKKITSIEGASLIKINNRYIVYYDINGMSDLTGIFVSEDLENWTTPNILALPQKFYHFTPVIVNQNNRSIINKFFEAYNYPNFSINNMKFGALNEFNIENYNLAYFLPLPGSKYVLYTTSNINNVITPKNWFFGGENINASYIITNMSGANSFKVRVGQDDKQINGLNSLILGFYFENYSGAPVGQYKYRKQGNIPVPRTPANTAYKQTIHIDQPTKINGVHVTPYYVRTLTADQILQCYIQYLAPKDFTICVIANFQIDAETLQVLYETY